MEFKVLDDFVSFIFVPHLMVYIIYITIKCHVSVSLEVLCNLIDHHKLDCDEDSAHFSLFCILTFGCFCGCCGNCCCFANDLFVTVIEYSLNFDRWLIKLLLGRGGGVIERHHDAYRPDEESNGKPFAPIYIRYKRLNSFEVNMLSTLLFTFGLVIGITAFDIYFLDVLHACTDDRSYSCFVSPVDPLANNAELGITTDRINSCIPWENVSISDQVYVVCYKWIYNFKGVTVAVRGWLTVLLKLLHQSLYH